LRELGDSLFVPVDSDLIPRLLEDEVKGLVRDWGLVFLPDGEVLMFDRMSPVEPSALLVVEPIVSSHWSSLPAPRFLADRIAEISLDLPIEPADGVYGRIADGPRRGRPAKSAGDHESDSEAAGDPTTETGDESGQSGDSRTAAGSPDDAGGRTWTQSISRWVDEGKRGFASWKERKQWSSIDQSALLRKLVREFRDGDRSLALRRAVPIARPDEPTTPGGQGWRVGGSDRLPWVRAVYNLADLLRRPARGQSLSVGIADADVLNALRFEYRKAADEAVRQGDFRRAAYILGILLRDDRSAAACLQRGGLHRDAALVYLTKLNDIAAAAQAFEAAGDIDRAVDLYRQAGLSERAGDALRRIGEEDRAIAEFIRAAQKHTSAIPTDFLTAGNILLNKARRVDLALTFFNDGWARLPQPNAKQCGLVLARIHAERGEADAFLKLLEKAISALEPGDSIADFGDFLNKLLDIVAHGALAEHADEIRDRILIALARRLDRAVALSNPAGRVISQLFGKSSLWSPSLLRDADFAASARARSRLPRLSGQGDSRSDRFPVADGRVTAACQASSTHMVVLGFDDGRVLGYYPGLGVVVPIAESRHAVTSLSVDPQGQTVVALRRSERGSLMSYAYRNPDGSFRSRPDDHIPSLSESWLTPIVPRGVERLVGLADGADLMLVDASSGMHWGRLTIADDPRDPPTAAILIPADVAAGAATNPLVVFTHQGPHWVVLDAFGKLLYQTSYYFRPAKTGSDPFFDGSTVSWQFSPPHLFLVSVDADGVVSQAEFELGQSRVRLLQSRIASADGGYRGAICREPNLVIAWATDRIEWLKPNFRGIPDTRALNAAKVVRLDMTTAVACFAGQDPTDILVVHRDGTISTVGLAGPVPARASR
jgi:tetratricopeptide (TPR) repeat protein